MPSHDPDYFSLAAGLLFTLLGLGLAVSAVTGWSVDGRVVAPLILIVLGAGGVAASLSASRRQSALAAQAQAGTAGGLAPDQLP